MNDIPSHDWEILYPRGTWPVYRCIECSRLWCPTLEELKSEIAPSRFLEKCVKESENHKPKRPI